MGLNKASKYKKGTLKSGFSRLGQRNKADGLDLSVTEAAISDYLEDVIKRLKDSLTEHDNVASGTLASSITYSPMKFSAGQYTVELVFEDYGLDVDEGRKAEGFSKEKRNKLQPRIYAWLGAPKFDSHIKSKAEQRSMSYAIATNILRRGTKGTKWATEVIGKDARALEKEMTQVISAILNRDIKIQVDKMAKDSLKHS